MVAMRQVYPSSFMLLSWCVCHVAGPLRRARMATAGQVLLDGERTSGQDVRTANVTAAMAIANIVKSSLGPVGLDKMLVDDIGDVTITNDGATILKQLEVEHPAAKVRAVMLLGLGDDTPMFHIS